MRLTKDIYFTTKKLLIKNPLEKNYKLRGDKSSLILWPIVNLTI